MTGKDLLGLFKKYNREAVLIGSLSNGLIVAPDMQGRFFVILDGKVVNRVVSDAIVDGSGKNGQQNPGGDVLWPAPEGSTMGYMYPGGQWAVPKLFTKAKWETVKQDQESVIIQAEIQLENNSQVVIPCLFQRQIKINHHMDTLTCSSTEVIQYIGNSKLAQGHFMLAPWSLCQINSDPGDKVIMPMPRESAVWDLYADSSDQRSIENSMLALDTQTDKRIQIAMDGSIPWIRWIGKNLSVTRYSGIIKPELKYMDIADVPPTQAPSKRETNLSVYCDPQGFIELEACGGTMINMKNGDQTTVTILTEYRKTEKEN